MREIGRWTGFLATSAWALLWLPAYAGVQPSQLWTFAAGFSVPLVFLTLLAQSLQRHYGAAYTGLYGGLARRMPRFAGVLVVSVLAATATPLFPTFFAMLHTLIVSQPIPAVALTVIWLIWSWAAARLLQGLIVGPAEPSPELDLGIRTTWGYATGLAGLVVVGLILIGESPMSIPLGLRLKIRAMIHVAAEPIPFFWPMRTFIHHNPLHGLEHLPFEQAAHQGAELFHGRAFLPRRAYQRYLAEGKVDQPALSAAIARFLESREGIAAIDLQHWLTVLLTEIREPVTQPRTLAAISDMHALMHGREPDSGAVTIESLQRYLHDRLLGGRPVYESVDVLYGSEIGAELDELMIKSCLDFFDEGQSVWDMPGRESGLFAAWRDMASRNVPFYLHGLHVSRILEQDERPEGVIAYVLEQFGMPENQWVIYFTHELARLHGWTGFVKWRSSAKHYYWADRFPADLVDLVAIRLAVALALLRKDGRHQDYPWTTNTIAEAIDNHTAETYLRHELHDGLVLPAMAHKVDQTLLRGKDRLIQQVHAEYLGRKIRDEAREQVNRLLTLAQAAGSRDVVAGIERATARRVAGGLGGIRASGRDDLAAGDGSARDRASAGQPRRVSATGSGEASFCPSPVLYRHPIGAHPPPSGRCRRLPDLWNCRVFRGTRQLHGTGQGQ